VLGQLPIQRRPRVPPETGGRTRRDADCLRRLIHTQAREEPQPDDGRRLGVVILQASECGIDCQNLVGIRHGERSDVADVLEPKASAASDGSRSGMVDQDPTHCLRGGGVEVAATCPGNASRADELEIGLVNEGRGRERVPSAFAAYPELSVATQLVVDERQELLRGIDVAIGGGIHEQRHIGMTVLWRHASIVIMVCHATSCPRIAEPAGIGPQQRATSAPGRRDDPPCDSPASAETRSGRPSLDHGGDKLRSSRPREPQEAAAMSELLTFGSLTALFTLALLEIVLGIDNLVVISIITSKLPRKQQRRARILGLTLAALGRIILLFAITWVISLERAVLFELPFGGDDDGGLPFSAKDLVLVIGGVFLVAKATWEMHHSLEGDLADGGEKRASATFGVALAQILAMDLIFSIDSVLTAVGMVRPEDYSTFWVPLTIMIVAILAAIAVMIVFANPVGDFVTRHPTVKMLALAFMLMIGLVLVAEGLHQHIPRGYIYSGMAFSLFVEMLNLRMSANRTQRLVDATSLTADVRPVEDNRG